ncbi:MAG: M28 family metallopeptidase [Gaiellaceae bacterium]
MLPTSARASRRRPRRGSLERPVDGRLYRSAFLIVSLPLLILAFSITRPAALPAPLLPPNFDGAAAQGLAVEFANGFSARQPGSARDLGAASWLRDRFGVYGLPVSTDTWRQNVPGLGRVRLQNLWAVAGGRSPDAIVVMAHRDDTGVGPGANDDASGTATLVELARSYAQAVTSPSGRRIRAAHTVVFLSTDGGSWGGVGAQRFAERTPFHVVAAINLDAIGGHGPPRLVITGDRPRSPAASLVETAARRILEQTGARPVRASLAGQLLDLGFPITFREQGPFVARGVPAITITTTGERPPDAFTDRPHALDGTRLASLGRATQQLLGSLDQGVELTQGTTSFIWSGGRIVRGWAVELLLGALVIPYAVAVVDLFANCRRRRIALAPAARALQTRLQFWLFLGLVFYLFKALGAWPGGPARPPAPASAEAGDWPVAALLLFGAIGLAGWLVGRQRLVPRRPVSADAQIAGETVALLTLGVIALLVLATNPFSLVFVLPALHAWLWLPQVRTGRGPARALVFVLGLAGLAVLLLETGIRFGLGLDAPWYLARLAATGYVQAPTVAIVLAVGACGAQLAAAAAGRYAPYPARGVRPARGPIRELVRSVVLTTRARRRAQERERRAIGQ